MSLWLGVTAQGNFGNQSIWLQMMINSINRRKRKNGRHDYNSKCFFEEDHDSFLSCRFLTDCCRIVFIFAEVKKSILCDVHVSNVLPYRVLKTNLVWHDMLSFRCKLYLDSTQFQNEPPLNITYNRMCSVRRLSLNIMLQNKYYIGK